MNIDRESFLSSLDALCDGKPHLSKSHLGNALSLLKQALPPLSWVGIYRYEKSVDRLLLDAFQGTPACEEIKVGKGVVGECFEKGEAIFVPNVREYPNYICCDPTASSEICVCLYKGNEKVAVLDIDFPKGESFASEISFFEACAKRIENWL